MAELYPLFRYWPRLALFAWFVLSFPDVRFVFASPGQVDPFCRTDVNWEALIPQYGLKPLRRPKVVEPTSAERTYDLSVEYLTTNIAGCNVTLRSYNSPANAPRDLLVGDTIKAKSGDTIYIKLTNNLPKPSADDDFPQHPPPHGHGAHFTFNVTNLHTHGLHVSPGGDPNTPQSDNVFVEIPPGSSQDYEIKIPPDHPSGTFWYHAHLHGATAVQVSSGMAGMLIIEGGDATHGELKVIPEIKAATEQTFVLQQLVFGPNGTLDDFKGGFIDNPDWARHVTVNGQLVPSLTLRPGEVQRWRFVHAGISKQIPLVLDGHKLFEVAADGISLGRSVQWDRLELGPGYRTDVLVKAGLPGTYFLRSGALPKRLSFKSLRSALRLAESRNLDESPQELIARLPQFIADDPGDRIARIVIEGDPVDMKLPSDDQLKPVVPRKLVPITDGEITTATEQLLFNMAFRTCTNDGQCPLPKCKPGSTGCEQRFLAGANGDQVFMPDEGRTFRLNQVSKWAIGGSGESHVFHIHVNPFQVNRTEPDGVTRQIWRDTLIIVSGDPPVEIATRYSDFVGSFVMHCHVLNHEDRGMMEKITITP
jgi:FtsP/CotA-like multicopper oxidase with cupredoxin domain